MCEWFHEGPLSKIPRLAEKDSEKENNNLAFIKIATEVEYETGDRFNVYGGFTNEHARQETELRMLAGNRQIMYMRYQTFIKSIFKFHQS